MSSSFWREPLTGTIRQDQKVIGGVCLPEADVQEFIEQFNHCYGPLGMKIEPPAFIPLTSPVLVPVGAARRRPPVSAPSFFPRAVEDDSSES